MGVKLGISSGTLAILALGACTTPPVDSASTAEFTAKIEACCAVEDQFPVALVDALDKYSISVVPISRGIHLRASFLEDKPDAQAVILAPARPLDLIMIANRSRLSGLAGDGYFGHSAIYTGTESELRDIGVWTHPAVAKFHERIRAGAIAIESIDYGVHMSDAQGLMEADSAALFRTTGLSRARQREALIYLFTEIGKPFDNHFNLETHDAVYCTELIHDALPEMNIPVRMTYGRRAVWPDEIATHSLLGKTGFKFVSYVYAHPLGWEEQSASAMATRILRGWPNLEI